jgi:hypothetical protein
MGEDASQLEKTSICTTGYSALGVCSRQTRRALKNNRSAAFHHRRQSGQFIVTAEGHLAAIV